MNPGDAFPTSRRPDIAPTREKGVGEIICDFRNHV